MDGFRNIGQKQPISQKRKGIGFIEHFAEQQKLHQLLKNQTN